MSTSSSGRGPRIAYLLRRFPVLSQTFVVDEIADHLRAALDVHILAVQSERTAEYPVAALGSLFAGRVTYLDPAQRGVSPGLTGPGTPRADEDRVAKQDMAALKQGFASAIEHTDILHCHFGQVGQAAAATLGEIGAAAKLVVSFHGRDVTHRDYQPLQRFYARLFRRAHLLLPVNQLWRDRLVAAGADPARTIVHHMGVDTGALQPGLPRDRGDAFKLIMVSRLVEKKGHLAAIAALAMLRNRRPSLRITLDIVGDGPLRMPIAKAAAESGLADRIRLQGAVTHPEALRMIAEADLLLQPSLTAADGDTEGIPVVLMEAMALGVPVAASRHGGIPELVGDGVEGLLVGERDPLELAAAIERLADDDALRMQLARAGRDKVRREFDRRVLGKRLRALYLELLRRPDL